MWRDKFVEIKKAKGMSTKALSDASGVSTDTITRILNIEVPLKEGPRVETISILCDALGIEMWELFYHGDMSFVGLQAELASLKTERDDLVAENAVLKNKVENLRDKIDNLKDELINTHKNYHQIISDLKKN